MIGPEVSINAIDCSLSLLAVNGNSLIKALLVTAKPFVGKSEICIFTLDDLDGISVDLLDRADCDTTVVVLIEECPFGCRLPSKSTSQMVLCDQVLVILKSEAHHCTYLFLSHY